MRLPLIAATLAGVLAAAGCGGGDPQSARPQNKPTTTLSASPDAAGSGAPDDGEGPRAEPNIGDRALRVGQPRRGSGSTTTLQEIRFPYPGDDEFRTPAKPGDKFLGLKVRQCVADSFDPSVDGEFLSTYVGEWYAVAPSGEQLPGGASYNDWPRPKFPEGVTMSPGECLAGWLTLEVPADYKIQKMLWRSGNTSITEWLP